MFKFPTETNGFQVGRAVIWLLILHYIALYNVWNIQRANLSSMNMLLSVQSTILYNMKIVKKLDNKLFQNRMSEWLKYHLKIWKEYVCIF